MLEFEDAFVGNGYGVKNTATVCVGTEECLAIGEGVDEVNGKFTCAHE